MDKKNGTHLYINISNFSDILEKEEKLNKNEPRHSIHALDTYFSSIETFCKHHIKNSTVEKITGSRLHIYIEDSIANSFLLSKKIGLYANKLSNYLLNSVGKYKSLVPFKIQIGLAYGRFYIFNFQNSEHDELTSIGYACNYAAKLQSLSENMHITISSDIFESIPQSDKENFIKLTNVNLIKYGQNCCYTSLISKLTDNEDFSSDLNLAIKYANKINLYDMKFTTSTKPLKYGFLSKKECKTLLGIPLFADVRDFTSQFNEDDSNLEEMSIKTQEILQSMYTIVIENNGIHIQFQGDREFALFHNYGDYSCYRDAVLTGLRIIDAVKKFCVSVGVGQSFGKMYASKIGAHSEKDYILIGKTVNEADLYEDEHADKNQVVISEDIYKQLLNIDKILASQFKKDKIYNFYFTTQGFEEYSKNSRLAYLKNNTLNKKYNGAWFNESN